MKNFVFATAFAPKIGGVERPKMLACKRTVMGHEDRDRDAVRVVQARDCVMRSMVRALASFNCHTWRTRRWRTSAQEPTGIADSVYTGCQSSIRTIVVVVIRTGPRAPKYFSVASNSDMGHDTLLHASNCLPVVSPGGGSVETIGPHGYIFENGTGQVLHGFFRSLCAIPTRVATSPLAWRHFVNFTARRVAERYADRSSVPIANSMTVLVST